MRREDRDTVFDVQLTNQEVLINASDETLTHHYQLQQPASASFCCRPNLGAAEARGHWLTSGGAVAPLISDPEARLNLTALKGLRMN